MEARIANYMLPAMQVVCHLVISGNSTINVTTPVPAVGQTQPPPHQPLPDGYVEYSNIGFAYKVYDESVTALEAKERCIQEGARLALIDSAKKLRYVKNQRKSADFAHVGIVRMYDDDVWVDASTGLPVPSLPWISTEPSGKYDCVLIHFDRKGLGNYPCRGKWNYVCELPIRKKIRSPPIQHSHTL